MGLVSIPYERERIFRHQKQAAFEMDVSSFNSLRTGTYL